MVDISKIWGSKPDREVRQEIDFRASPLVGKPGARYGWAKDIEDSELRETVRLGLAEFELSSSDLPLRPTNLPGISPLELGEDQEALISFGFDYLLSIINDAPRRRYNIWANASDWLRHVKLQAGKEAVANLLADVEAGRVKIKLESNKSSTKSPKS